MNGRWFVRVFASAVVRRVAYVLVALVLAWVGMGKAHAQQVDDARCMGSAQEGAIASPQPLCSSQQLAYENTGNWLRINRPTQWNGVITGPACIGNGRYCRYMTSIGGAYIDVRYYDSQGPCPGGGVWNDATKKCDVACANRATDGSASFDDSLLVGNYCKDGCVYGVVLGAGETGTFKRVGGRAFVSGAKPTGSSCTTDTPTAIYDPDKPVCVSTGGGYSECVKPNGQHCVTSAAGRSLCWNPGDTGERITTDGTLGGDREKVPTTPTPPSNQNDPTTAVESTTNVNGQDYNTIITTGTGAGPGQPNTGVPGDGDGNGEGEGDDDEGTASGGEDCNAAPVTTGDPVLGMVARQSWLERCGTRKGDADGDGVPDYLKPGPGDGDGTDGNDEADAEGGKVKTVGLGLNVIDQGGLFGGGAGQCPTLGVLDFGIFGTYSLDEQPWWCDLVALMRAAFLILGAYLALRILME